MTFEERVEAISDEFQSTFTPDPRGLVNCLFVDDLMTVETLVKKHFGVTEVSFYIVQVVMAGGLGYGIYLIEFDRR